MKLSANFSLKEFTKSQTAIRHGIDNNPQDEHLDNAKELFANVMQPVRDEFGSTTITSGYRSPALNAKIGGSSRSQHSKGEACDFECSKASNLEVAEWIQDNLDFDQLILEFFVPGDPHSGWVHCSYKADGSNRKQVLTAVKENGKTVYKSGLVS